MILLAASAKASIGVAAVLGVGAGVLMLMFWVAMAWAAFKRTLSMIKVLIVGTLVSVAIVVCAVVAIAGGLFVAG